MRRRFDSTRLVGTGLVLRQNDAYIYCAELGLGFCRFRIFAHNAGFWVEIRKRYKNHNSFSGKKKTELISIIEEKASVKGGNRVLNRGRDDGIGDTNDEKIVAEGRTPTSRGHGIVMGQQGRKTNRVVETLSLLAHVNTTVVTVKNTKARTVLSRKLTDRRIGRGGHCAKKDHGDGNGSRVRGGIDNNEERKARTIGETTCGVSAYISSNSKLPKSNLLRFAEDEGGTRTNLVGDVENGPSTSEEALGADGARRSNAKVLIDELDLDSAAHTSRGDGQREGGPLNRSPKRGASNGRDRGRTSREATAETKGPGTRRCSACGRRAGSHATPGRAGEHGAGVVTSVTMSRTFG